LLLPRTNASFLNQIDGTATVATGSIRRRAQWLLKYPNHKLENLRGNVNTRLQKLGANGWDGAIFAAAGLERIGLRPANAVSLDWMIPAPAQGAIGITCLEMQPRFIEILKQITHQKTERTTQEERAFLRTLEGGCSAPIGALVQEVQEGWLFEGILVTPDGTKHIRVREICERNSLEGLGKRMAKQVLDEGGHDIMKTIRDAGL
jgi:hydroxymethylbilane synthase